MLPLLTPISANRHLQIAGEPVKLRRRPVVKFWDMTKELQNGGEADSERDEDSSDEEDVAECSVADWEVSDTAFALDEDVDLAAPVLCDMISETGPPIGDQSNAKGKASSTTIQSSSKPDVPDYDFQNYSLRFIYSHVKIYFFHLLLTLRTKFVKKCY